MLFRLLRLLVGLAVLAHPVPTLAQEPARIAPPPCIAVKPIGSHGFRNILFAGVAGALISKEQYQVVKVSAYPAQLGQKFHGSDLKTLQDGGTKVIILPKKFSPEDIVKACQQ